MELRSAGVRRLLALFVFGVFGYIVFYNALVLDRRGATLPGRLLFQRSTNSSTPHSSSSAADPANGAGDSAQAGVQPAAAASAGASAGAAGASAGAAGASAGASAASAGAPAQRPSSKPAAQKLPPPPAAPASKSTPTSRSTPTSPEADSIRRRLDAGFRIANGERCPARGRHLRLVILITSAPDHERNRKAIRLTWGGAVAQRRDVALLFVLGRTSETVQRAVDAEQQTYGDIMQGNFVDAYKNLTLKSAVMLEWLDTFCPEVRMVLKTDDDMFINTDNLLKFVEVHSKDTNRLYGRLARRWKPSRNSKSKYYLSFEAFKDKYLPDFVTGPAYVMTGDLVKPLYHATLNARFLILEDVLVTGLVADKLKIKRVSAKEFINERIKVDTCKFATAISVHMVKFDEQFDIWKRIQDGKTRCPRPYVPTGG